MAEAERRINTLDDIRGRVDRVRRMAKRGDDEGAHAEQDVLWRYVLEAIANQRVAPAEAARIALETRDIKFSRWYS